MAAPGAPRQSGKRAGEARIPGARDVTAAVLVGSPRILLQVEPAVDNRPRAVEVRGEVLR